MGLTTSKRSKNSKTSLKTDRFSSINIHLVSEQKYSVNTWRGKLVITTVYLSQTIPHIQGTIGPYSFYLNLMVNFVLKATIISRI